MKAAPSRNTSDSESHNGPDIYRLLSPLADVDGKHNKMNPSEYFFFLRIVPSSVQPPQRLQRQASAENFSTSVGCHDRNGLPSPGKPRADTPHESHLDLSWSRFEDTRRGPSASLVFTPSPWKFVPFGGARRSRYTFYHREVEGRWLSDG